MSNGIFFIVTAPSGAGKTSLVNALVESEESLCVSVSYTTRPARLGEIEGENYHFVSKDQFIEMLEGNQFLESAEVYGHRYGTSHAWVKDKLKSGTDVILEIDWQGAEQIRCLFPDACSVFILPPSVAALNERLQTRAQDDAETIENRMRQAVNEMTHMTEADYVIINDNFDTAKEDLRAVIRSRRLTMNAQETRQAQLMDSLTRH
jgi:guanylate kinase